MEFPAINQDELDTILSLASRFIVLGKSTLYMVPSYLSDDDPETRGRLIQKSIMADHLTELGLFTDVTNTEETAQFRKAMAEAKKREIKIYLLSPMGLAFGKTISDQWDDEDKANYTKRLESRLSDDAHAAHLAGIDDEITAIKGKLK